MGQKPQLERLGVKYANEILTSHLNEKREYVTTKAKVLYKKIATKHLMSILLASTSNSKKPKKDFPGAVLFRDEDSEKIP